MIFTNATPPKLSYAELAKIAEEKRALEILTPKVNSLFLDHLLLLQQQLDANNNAEPNHVESGQDSPSTGNSSSQISIDVSV